MYYNMRLIPGDSRAVFTALESHPTTQYHIFSFGRGRIRTRGPRLRRPVHYPGYATRPFAMEPPFLHE